MTSPASNCPTISIAMAALAASLVAPGAGNAVQERRSQAGARLFRSLLAADLRLPDKTAPDGSLLLLVFHTTSADVARQIVPILAGDGPTLIRDLPVQVELTNDPTLAAFAERRPAWSVSKTRWMELLFEDGG